MSSCVSRGLGAENAIVPSREPWVTLRRRHPGTIVPAVLFMLDVVPLDAVKSIMLLSTIVWFPAAPFWMKVT